MVYTENGENGNRSVNMFGTDFNNRLDTLNGTQKSEPIYYDRNTGKSSDRGNLLFVYRDGGNEFYDKDGRLQYVEGSQNAQNESEERDVKKKKVFKKKLSRANEDSTSYTYPETDNAQDAQSVKKSKSKLDKRMNGKLVVLLVSYIALIAIIIVMVSLSNYRKGQKADYNADLHADAATAEYVRDDTDPYYFGKTGIVIESDSEEDVVIAEKEDAKEQYGNAFDKFCDLFDLVFGGR